MRLLIPLPLQPLLSLLQPFHGDVCRYVDGPGFFCPIFKGTNHKCDALADAPYCSESKRGKQLPCRAPYPGETLLTEATGFIQVYFTTLVIVLCVYVFFFVFHVMAPFS